ncbi:MAG: ABC-F family ATP-binding cassette domain-containing protein [Chloroflexi bacterium]|nr:ABC-F family ATP-binding cassette domain-containing protein [Chloroflexota bacterium]
MALVTGKDLARSYGADDIFSGVTVSIPHRARIAVVGPNGSGKTSLLRMLARLDPPDEGSINAASDLRIGYLAQESTGALDESQTLWTTMLDAFTALREDEAQLAEMAEQIAQNPDDVDLIDRYGAKQHRFEERGGYDYEARIHQVLGGLGFTQEQFHQRLEMLSGGQKTRALLARLLLESPALLLLDEPTNHLDIHAIEWLEKYLSAFDGAVLVVSHDRAFMDGVVNHIWELIFGRLEEYRGNYSHYVQQRDERHERLWKEFQRQQAFIEKERDYIRRNIAGQNTRQAQGRRKRLERFLRDEAIAAPREHGEMHLTIDTDLRSGDEVIRTKGLIVGYDEPLFEVPDLVLRRGACAALIGPNGAGKSTLIKTLLGRLDPLVGQARLGANVHIGYFAQAHEELNPNNTILDEILGASPMTVEEGRTYLGTFLFTGDDSFKQISTLSGGERGRVALAKLALSGANLLLLDEPTNHLDIPSQEILEQVLADYSGTIVLVSHDRYLIRRLATQIWSIPREGGELVVYEGGYDRFVAEQVPASQSDNGTQRKAPTRSQEAASENDRHYLTPYQRRQRLAEVEAHIHKLEVELVDIKGGLQQASEAGDVARVSDLGKAYSETQAALDELMEEWEWLVADV